MDTRLEHTIYRNSVMSAINGSTLRRAEIFLLGDIVLAPDDMIIHSGRGLQNWKGCLRNHADVEVNKTLFV